MTPSEDVIDDWLRNMEQATDHKKDHCQRIVRTVSFFAIFSAFLVVPGR